MQLLLQLQMHCLPNATCLFINACLHNSHCNPSADGYGRMAGRPALTVLHLGPGLANALANLHNARRAGTPLVNLVGGYRRVPGCCLAASALDTSGICGHDVHMAGMASFCLTVIAATASLPARPGPGPLQATWPPGTRRQTRAAMLREPCGVRR